MKVFIVKDRIGAFHEYGERQGQSFFHDEPDKDPMWGFGKNTHSTRTVYLQARHLFSRFYGNGIEPQQLNPLRQQMIEHPNCKVMYGYKLYDHSKLIIVDGEVAYVGGIGFGDEFYGDEENEPWGDYMLKMGDKGKCDELLSLLSGRKVDGGEGINFINDFALMKQGSSLHERVLKLILEAKERLLIEMPFLGHPDYINAITDVVSRGVETLVVFPRRAASHHFRNLHFLKRLVRQVGHSDKLTVSMSPRILHGKVLVADEKMLFGSHNLHMDQSVLEEVVVEVGDVKVIEGMCERIRKNAASGEQFDDSVRWRDIIVPSRAEYLSVKLQTLMGKLRRGEISMVRREYMEFVRGMMEKLG